MKKVDKNLDLEMGCDETIRQIVEELKIRYPERKEILYANITDYITGYEEISATTHDTLSRTIFFGLTTREVKNFLKKYPFIRSYEDFKTLILKERKNRTKLNKKIVDDLLLRSIHSSDIVNELKGWFSGDFLIEVNKYYPNFKVAKWIVKAPYIIRGSEN